MTSQDPEQDALPLDPRTPEQMLVDQALYGNCPECGYAPLTTMETWHPSGSVKVVLGCLLCDFVAGPSAMDLRHEEDQKQSRRFWPF
jgi:hypothetical protein